MGQVIKFRDPNWRTIRTLSTMSKLQVPWDGKFECGMVIRVLPDGTLVRIA